MTSPVIHEERQSFQVFRMSDSVGLEHSGAMDMCGAGPIATKGMEALAKPQLPGGYDTRMLFSMPGFSLAYAWFKPQFPLPRHTHNCDCLYYIVAGSLQIGEETLRAGDGFFVGKDVPYTYVAGPEGVEILEFRDTNDFDIKIKAENETFWTKALETLISSQAMWKGMERPSGMDISDLKPVSET